MKEANRKMKKLRLRQMFLHQAEQTMGAAEASGWSVVGNPDPNPPP